MNGTKVEASMRVSGGGVLFMSANVSPSGELSEIRAMAHDGIEALPLEAYGPELQFMIRRGLEVVAREQGLTSRV